MPKDAFIREKFTKERTAARTIGPKGHPASACDRPVSRPDSGPPAPNRAWPGFQRHTAAQRGLLWDGPLILLIRIARGWPVAIAAASSFDIVTASARRSPRSARRDRPARVATAAARDRPQQRAGQTDAAPVGELLELGGDRICTSPVVSTRVLQQNPSNSGKHVQPRVDRAREACLLRRRGRWTFTRRERSRSAGSRAPWPPAHTCF